MRRILYAGCLAVFMMLLTQSSFAQRGRSEFALGYGHFSMFQFANRPYGPSSGTTSLTYRYYISKDVTLGMGIGYENISSWAAFTSIMPELTVKYLDTKDDLVRVRLYGAVSWGISVLSDNHIGQGMADESGVKPYGVQFTPIGMRIGRTFAGFLELGYGYKGIVNGGVALRFPRHLQHRNREANN